MSENTPGPSQLRTVHEALIDVRRAVGAVDKSDRNEQGSGYNFRGIDRVVNATAGPLLDAGVSIVPAEIRHVEQVDVKSGAKRTDMQATRVTIRWRVYGPGGDHFDVESIGEAYDSGDKATPKASTVAWRTVLLQLLHIPTDDPDPDSYTYDRNDEDRHVPEPTPVDLAKTRAWDATKGAGDQGQRLALLASRLPDGAELATATEADFIHAAVSLEVNGFDVPANDSHEAGYDGDAAGNGPAS